MILGRPTNLWLGFVQAAVGFASLVAVTVLKADPIAVATLAGGSQLLLGAGVALVAGQSPTVNAGDTVKVQTPKGEANYEVVA